MAPDPHASGQRPITPPQTPVVTPAENPRVRYRISWVWLLGGFGLVLGCLLVCLGVAAVTLLNPAPRTPITVIVAGTAYQLETSAPTVGALLDELTLKLNTSDAVSPSLDTPISKNMLVNIERARTVTLTIDGITETRETLFSNPLDILKDAGIEPGEKDRITVDGTETDPAELLVWPVPATSITIQHAITVNIEDEGQITTIQTTRSTVGDALFEAGITLYLADTVTPDLSEIITPDMSVAIHRSQPVTVIADGVSLETRTQGNTVAQALISAGIPLMGQDYAIPDETSPLQPGMTVRVIRVTEKVDLQQDTLPFETVYQGDANLELDQRVTLQEGRNGIQQTTIRIRYENGIEVSREAENTSVASEPANRIIAYGTNIVSHTLDTPDGPVTYWRKLRMYATSYHPAALGGDNITATGRVLTKGVVGIDPKIIPYGTQLFVPGYGVGVAGDTGGPRRFKLWIDLGYDDENWVSWSKYTDVYLLFPVPADIVYMLPE